MSKPDAYKYSYIHAETPDQELALTTCPSLDNAILRATADFWEEKLCPDERCSACVKYNPSTRKMIIQGNCPHT